MAFSVKKVMNENTTRYLSILLVFLMGGSFLLGVVPQAQVSSTQNGITIAASNEWIGQGIVVLISVYNPYVPQNALGAKYVLDNISVGNSTLLEPLSNFTGTVYYVHNNGHYFWFFITMSEITNSKTGTSNLTKISNTYYVNGPYISQTQTVYNNYLIYNSQLGITQFELVKGFPFTLTSNYNVNISASSGNAYVNVSNLYYFNYGKQITIKYTSANSQAAPGPSITINNYNTNSAKYSPMVTPSPLVSGQNVPLNSTWELFFNDSILQASPFYKLNGIFYNSTTQEPVPVLQNVSYISIQKGIYVPTEIFADNNDSNALALFGYGDVYGGNNFTIYTSSVITNSTYATLSSYSTLNHVPYLNYTPSYVNSQQYENLIQSGVFSQTTPIEITVQDVFGNSASMDFTGQIKETTVTSFKISLNSTTQVIKVNAFDNISNFSHNEIIKNVYISLISSTGSRIQFNYITNIGQPLPLKPVYSAKIALNETYNGSGIFSIPIYLELNQSSTPTILIPPYEQNVTVYLPPYDFSNTTILINATNDYGASYYFLGSKAPVNQTGTGTIAVGTPSLTSVYPAPGTSVTTSNVTNYLKVEYYEPNLAFGSTTTITVSNGEIYYSGIPFATESAQITVSGSSPKPADLSELGVHYITSPSGNGNFTFTITRAALLSVINKTYIPSGTTLTITIKDQLTSQTLTLTYTFQTYAPTITVLTPTGSSSQAYFPPLPYNVLPEKHYINVTVTDQQYAQTLPNSVLTSTVKIYVENSSNDLATARSLTTASIVETSAGSGKFTASIYYTVTYINGTYYFAIDGNNVAPLTKIINGGKLVFSYTSPASNTQVNTTVTLSTSPFSLTTTPTTALPGQKVNVTVSSPGLVEATNMKYSGSLKIYAQLVEWNGYTQPTIVTVPITLKEVATGSPVFGGSIVLGNSSVASVNNVTSLITASGFTVAPDTVVLINANASIGITSTISSIVTYYTQQQIAVLNPGVNYSILNPTPASPFAKLKIELNSPLFQLFSHPSAAGNYSTLTSSDGSLLLANQIATISTQNSKQLITGSALISNPNVSFYYNNSVWIITVPMKLWNGLPISSSIPLNVNLTDVVTVTPQVNSVHYVLVPNVSTGTVNIASAYYVPSVSSKTVTLNINGQVPPVISIIYNGENVTSGSVPFPNVTAGELVNVTVYAPDAVLNPNVPATGSTFNVTVVNTLNGEMTTLILTEIGSGPYYSGLLRIVPPTVYSPGVSGLISYSPGQLNKVVVNMNVLQGTYYNYQGLNQALKMIGSAYFNIGILHLNVSVSKIGLTLSNGTPVTSMKVGTPYHIYVNITNTGNVNETIYGVLEIYINGSAAQLPVISTVTLSPGQSFQVGTLFTPTMPGNYTVTFVPYENVGLSVPYTQSVTTIIEAS
ncbi:MAG: S-layer protein SlaA [Metallosphaera sp.]|uniref:S-layer protein SlaA n=1 Tax=Metallosphaera sp. TaxID=2020860 RepID=UPI003178163D